MGSRRWQSKIEYEKWRGGIPENSFKKMYVGGELSQLRWWIMEVLLEEIAAKPEKDFKDREPEEALFRK